MVVPITATYLIIALLFGRAAAIQNEEPVAAHLFVWVGLLWLPYLIFVNMKGEPHGRGQ